MQWTFRRALATALAVFVLNVPSFLAYFEDRFFPHDLSKVFLANACMRASTQTIFVENLLEVLVAAALMGHNTAPAIFGDKWEAYDAPKRRKMIGNIVKIVVRLQCITILLIMVAPNVTTNNGPLFVELNSKEAASNMAMKGISMTCEEAGATPWAAQSLRSWVFIRCSLMSVMAWELAAVPGLGVDIWLHHIFIMVGVMVSTDSQIQGLDTSLQPIIDGLAFWLVLGASLAAFVEVFVLVYHLTAQDPGRQAKAMLASMIVQSTVVPVFFLIFPVWLSVRNHEEFGGLIVAIFVILLFLVAVEVRMIFVKFAIFKKALKKQKQNQKLEGSSASGSFASSSSIASELA